MTSEILRCWGHFGWRVFERVFALVFGIYSQKWQRRVFALKPKARERGRGDCRAFTGRVIVRRWVPATAPGSTEEGEFSSACATTQQSFPLPLPSRRHFSFIVVGKPTKRPTWHDIAWRNSSNNNLFICFAKLISSDLVYILDSGLRRVWRNFGEEELQILTYIWKFDSLVWMYPLVARKTFNIPWQHERARLPQCSQATVVSSATTFTCHESSTTTGQECND